jgi:hypothetical protein
VNYEHGLTYMTVVKLNMVTCGGIMRRVAAVIYNMKTISNSNNKYIKSSMQKFYIIDRINLFPGVSSPEQSKI